MPYPSGKTRKFKKVNLGWSGTGKSGLIGGRRGSSFVKESITMAPTIFPFELTHPGTESLNAKITRRSSLMFIILVGILILALGALPLIKVEVGVQARGNIRDIQNNVAISSSIQGQVLYHYLFEDRPVKKGEELLVLNATALETEKEKIEEQLQIVLDMQYDLNLLLHVEKERPTLRSSIYQQTFSQYIRELNTLELKEQYSLGVLQRVSKLYQEHIVAKVEIEKAQLDADLASSDLRLLIEQQRKAWEIEAQNLRQQILELRTKLSLLHNQSKNYTILAPSDGVLLQASGIKAGSYILPGQQLAFLSTQDSLLAEVYVPANQIGYLQKGMIVRLLIDAYNFHEWGIINGKVQEISSEIKIINKIPVLVASVSLAQQELKLKNGYKGKLRKGMTLSAHFTLQRRSLLSLLYDKAEDWLDPRKSSKQ